MEQNSEKINHTFNSLSQNIEQIQNLEKKIINQQRRRGKNNM